MKKAQEMNNELINKVVESELALSKAKSENFMLTKKTLDLMFTLSLNISENNKLKQLLQKLDVDTNKALTTVGEISSVLLNTKHCLTDNQNLFKKSGEISLKENSRNSGNTPTNISNKFKKSESQTMNSVATIKSLKRNSQELYARKKNDREFKIYCGIEDNLSPITEIISPQVLSEIRYRRTLGRRFLDLESRKDKENKNNSFNQVQTLAQSELDDNEKIRKSSTSSNNENSSKSQSSNSSNQSIDNTPKKKRTSYSKNSNTSKQRSISAKLSCTSELGVEQNNLKLQRKEASTTFEEVTETQSKRTRRRRVQTGSTKDCQSKKRRSITDERLSESNLYSFNKEKENRGSGSRRSQRTKTKVTYNEYFL
ncbi:formin-J-like isoform X2 [Cimex lectularius]|uniref:Uncharacterized protein n=1 Tax=Cimex lectularius TaxID=79782 RepID=A0A8I6RJ81_CIMLE|nr:formin-J-like isoform X2 [Cimex lectularius]